MKKKNEINYTDKLQKMFDHRAKDTEMTSLKQERKILKTQLNVYP